MQHFLNLSRLTASRTAVALICSSALVAALTLVSQLHSNEDKSESPFADSLKIPRVILADASAKESMHIRFVDDSGLVTDQVTMADGTSKVIYFADTAGNLRLRELVYFAGIEIDGSKVLFRETKYSPVDGGILNESTYNQDGRLESTATIYATDDSVKQFTGETMRFRRQYLDPQGRPSRVVESTLKGVVAREVKYSANGVRLWQRDNNLAASTTWAVYHYDTDGVTIKRREVRSYAYFEVEDYYPDGATVRCHSQVYQWRNNLTCHRADGTYEYMITKVRKANQLEVSAFDKSGALVTKRYFKQEIVQSGAIASTVYKLEAVTVYSRRHGIVGSTDYKIDADGTVRSATSNGQPFKSGLRAAPADWLKVPTNLTLSFAAEVEAKKVDSETTAMAGRI